MPNKWQNHYTRKQEISFFYLNLQYVSYMRDLISMDKNIENNTKLERRDCRDSAYWCVLAHTSWEKSTASQPLSYMYHWTLNIKIERNHMHPDNSYMNINIWYAKMLNEFCSHICSSCGTTTECSCWDAWSWSTSRHMEGTTLKVQEIKLKATSKCTEISWINVQWNPKSLSVDIVFWCSQDAVVWYS
jgi:hypothetical protein